MITNDFMICKAKINLHIISKTQDNNYNIENNRHLIEKKQQSAHLGKNQQFAINKQKSSLFNINVAVII